MRIWDVSPHILCRKHLLGEHRELHSLWTIISQDKKGYRQHPETRRWEGKLAALYKRHDEEVREMIKRGYRHNSPLDKQFAFGESKQNKYVHSIEEQREILKSKKCSCKV